MKIQRLLNKVLILAGFIIVILIVFAIISWKKVKNTGEDIALIEKENQGLYHDIELYKESLEVSKEIRKREAFVKDSLNNVVLRFNSIIVTKNQEIASLKGKYKKITNDSLVVKVLHEYEVNNDTTISRVENLIDIPRPIVEWTLETNDENVLLKDVIVYKDSTIEAKDGRISSDSTDIAAYKKDLTTKDSIEVTQTKIIDNKDKIIDKKDDQIDGIKKERNIERGGFLVALLLILFL